MENQLLNAKRKSFGIYEAALATILFILFTGMFSFVYTMIAVSVGISEVVYYIASFISPLVIASAAYVTAKARKVDFVHATGLNKKVNSDCVFYAIIVSFVCMLFFSDLTNVFLAFLDLCGYSSVLPDIEINNFGIYIIYILASCVAPAFCEDLLFRGVIASGLKEKGLKVALFGSALIFTFMHGNAEQTIHQFVIGMVLGYIFLKTGNVWLGVIVHFVNNFMAVTGTYLLTILSKSESAVETVDAVQSAVSVPVVNPWVALLIDLIFAVIFAYIGYLILKKVCKKIIAANNKANNIELGAENATIKVDDAEVAVEMTIDGEVAVGDLEQSAKTNVGKEKKSVPLAVILMFVIAGAYFAIEWLTALLSGLGLF